MPYYYYGAEKFASKTEQYYMKFCITVNNMHIPELHTLRGMAANHERDGLNSLGPEPAVVIDSLDH
jgi:hypothetical protein